MKFFTYIARNVRRNPVRSLLTIASVSVSLFLMMIIVSFFTVFESVVGSLKVHNRVIVLSSQGFGGKVPIARVNEIRGMDGIDAATPLAWFGGKFREQRMPFAQFGVEPTEFFKVYDELTLPDDQLRAFAQDKAGCVIGRRLAEDHNLKLGDPLPLKADLFPVDLNLVVRGIYDGPANRDRRMCVFHYDYLDDLMKASSQAAVSGNAGAVVVKCRSADVMAAIGGRIDREYVNSETPTKTRTEEAFNKLFLDMFGDLKGMVRNIGLAVVFSLLCVAGNAMAMALRERTTEIAVLKAIGFPRGTVLFLVLAEATAVAGVGGLIGTLGTKALFDLVDVSRYTMGALPFFFVPWPTALMGLGVSLLVGFASGVVPAVRAARLSVVNGLRKVV
jgi:putative ABC transport system permease protein